MIANPAAALCGVTKHFHDFTLGPLVLEIPTGSIVGLVGENGAGKTTALKILTGVNRPDSGRVTLLGAAPADPAARAEVGAVFEEAYFYESMTPAQVGRCLGGIFGSRWDSAYYGELLGRFGLDSGKPMKEFSRGMRMKLSLASALGHRPRLLVLDEATSGLDPVVRGEMLDLFLDFIQDEQHSILLSSHITSDLEQVADSIALLHQGRLIFHKNKDELMQEYGILRCSEDQLRSLPKDWVVASHRGGCGWESLIHPRARVLHALPGAVCDPANIDDIMRFYCGREHQ